MTRKVRIGEVLTIAGVLVATSCNSDTFVEDTGAELTFQVGGGGTRGLGEDVLTLNNALDDSAGLGGLTIEVHGIGERRTFSAADFDPVERESPSIAVPDYATIFIEARLTREGGDVVSEGMATWPLRGSGYNWAITISRAPHPSAVLSDEMDLVNPPEPPWPCVWDWCYGVWRFEIREDARNYESEAFWLSVYRPPRGSICDSPDIICF